MIETTDVCQCRQCLRDRNERESGWPAEFARMVVCPTCGDKRCPHATDHRDACTGSSAQIETAKQPALEAITQQGGTHYAEMKIEPWDASEAWTTKEQFAGHLLCSAIDYLARFNSQAPGKGGVGDARKALHCIVRLIEVLEGRPRGSGPSPTSPCKEPQQES